jgi:hypothetical protein
VPGSGRRYSGDRCLARLAQSTQEQRDRRRAVL